MSQPSTGRDTPKGRVLLLILIAGLTVIGLIFVTAVVGLSIRRPEAVQVDPFARSTDECVVCHRKTTPGIVEQYGLSSMAAAEVTCQNCHEVEQDYPGSVEHEGTYVLGSPTPARCNQCHTQEVAQFEQSRHSLPAYVAYAGSEHLDPQFLEKYQSIPEGSYAPDKMRNSLYAMEGPEITHFACESCHNIGVPQADGSVGDCTKCHLRHFFSLEQARKPETCNACHIGPDHPQYEIYIESPHGIAYHTQGDSWQWDANPGTLTVNDFPAPTCAICHMSGFGQSSTTHDVGDRLTWYLFAPISTRRPAWQDNLVRMQSACQECHNEAFIEDFYKAADAATETVNEWVTHSDDMMAPLKATGLLTDALFDEPIDFTYFEFWHHWGRTAKFGAWMQGPDYTQWHGAYEMLSDFAELDVLIQEKLDRGEP
jgi:hydroxylamine dehydrogenase